MARQLPLPGMGKIKPVKTTAAKESVDQTPTKEPKPKVDTLRSELVAGNRPMFMTAGELARIANLNDAGSRNATPISEEKSRYQKNRESRLLQKKLRESRTGTVENSHVRKEQQRGYYRHGDELVGVSDLPSLHESLSTEGFKGSFPLEESESMRYKLGSNEPGVRERYLNVYEGHHRLAAMRNINKNQFLPIKYR